MLGKILNTFSVSFPLGMQISKAAVIILGWRSSAEHIVCRTVCALGSPLCGKRWWVPCLHVPLLLETVWASGGNSSAEPLQSLLYMMFGHILKPLFPQPWNLLWVVAFCLVSTLVRAFPTCVYKPLVGVLAMVIPAYILLGMSWYSSGLESQEALQVGNDIHNCQWDKPKPNTQNFFKVFLLVRNVDFSYFVCL